MASLMMVRFHSSPISPRAMALEFSVPGSWAPALSGVRSHLRLMIRPLLV
jgi:hypothetical protein